MGRSPCCDKVGLKKGPWTPEEDQKLLTFIQAHGHGSWRALPAKAGLQRCGKSCRLRWTNYLRPDIKRGKFSLQEEQTIIQLHALLGNKWSAIASHLPKRTDNEIKNYWNTHLKKRLTKMGIDPVTHKPKHHEGLGSHAKVEAAHISHMAQWESARLEAEVRLGKESKQVMMTAANPTQTRHHHHMTSPTHDGLLSRAPPALPCLDVLKAWRGASWSLTAKPVTSSTIINNINNTGMISGTSSSMISAIDDLESPTSTLNFPHDPINTLSIPMQSALISTRFNGKDHEVPCQEMQSALISTRFNGKDHEVPCQENNDVTFGDCTDASAAAAASATWFVDSEETFTLPAGAFSDVIVEGLNDILVYNSEEQADQEKYVSVVGREVAECGGGGGGGGGDGSCGGSVFEENRSYWNSILSLVNASPAGSPMF